MKVTVSYILSEELLAKIIRIGNYEETFKINRLDSNTFNIESIKQIQTEIERTFRKNKIVIRESSKNVLQIKALIDIKKLQYLIYSEEDQTLAYDFIRELEKYFPDYDHQILIKLKK